MSEIAINTIINDQKIIGYEDECHKVPVYETYQTIDCPLLGEIRSNGEACNFSTCGKCQYNELHQMVSDVVYCSQSKSTSSSEIEDSDANNNGIIDTLGEIKTFLSGMNESDNLSNILLGANEPWIESWDEYKSNKS